MITQILIPYTFTKSKYSDNLSEDFTFSGKFPSKKDLINHIKSLISEYPNELIYSKCLKTVRAIKPKHWPVLNNEMSVTTPGSVEFEKDITIMNIMNSPFDKNIDITIVWKILTPCILN